MGIWLIDDHRLCLTVGFHSRDIQVCTLDRMRWPLGPEMTELTSGAQTVTGTRGDTQIAHRLNKQIGYQINVAPVKGVEGCTD